jgi:hypothetical protein
MKNGKWKMENGLALNRSLSLFVLIVLLGASVLGQERYLKPVDKAGEDASFLAFRNKLIAAVEKKDSRYILSIVDPKIQNGFGGRNGIANFKRDWKLDRHDSEFWHEFSWVIRNGGTFTGEGNKRTNSFAAPYIYSKWPEDLDAFDYFAITGTDVNVRKAPRADSEAVGKLSHNIVKIESDIGTDGQMPEWRRVTTLGGLTGYVHRDYVRSSVDYRAGFEKKRGRWVMTFFLAGD